MNLPGGVLAPAKVGNDAGWYLEIGPVVDGDLGTPVLSIGRSDYYAEISAELPGGLEAGSYQITIEGLTDDDYQSLAKLRGKPAAAKLYLYWRDTASSLGGYLASAVGLSDVIDKFGSKPDDQFLIATFAITKFHRHAGARRYETTIEGRELVYDLSQKRLDVGSSSGAPKDNNLDELERIAGLCKIKTNKHSDEYTPDPDRQAPEAVHPGERATERLRALASALENETNQHGRGMLLITNGVLHLGPREILVSEAINVADDNGLVETHVTGTQQIDLNWDPQLSTDTTDKQTGEPLMRNTYELICKGRPDLKPGQVLGFNLPPQEYDGRLQPSGYFAAAAASALAAIGVDGGGATGAPVTMYVSSVQHKLSRTEGFVTRVSGVDVTADSKWDTWTPSSLTSSQVDDPAASGAGKAKTAVDKRVTRAIAGKRLAEIAEIRRFTSKTPSSMGPTDAPSQTEGVIRGLVNASKSSSYDAPRLDIDRTSGGRLSAVPYVSPFAWGKTGLILPRYPGMRVLLEHRNGYPDDPLDVGAVWEWGSGPDTQPGDYWLILPAEIPSDKRDSIDDKDTPQPPTGKVTNDLIDADGNRIIELATLTVRVGQKSLNNVAQTRPQVADEEVSIEHKDSGAKITMDKDGNVTIHAAKDLTISADGNINVKGKQVAFSVDSMDVS